MKKRRHLASAVFLALCAAGMLGWTGGPTIQVYHCDYAEIAPNGQLLLAFPYSGIGCSLRIITDGNGTVIQRSCSQAPQCAKVCTLHNSGTTWDCPCK